MLSEMQRSVEGLASATSVVTGFRFTSKGTDVDREPARFNDYVIEKKTEVAKLRGNIRELKGSCEKVRESRDKLNEIAGDRNDWAAMFRLLSSKRHKRDAELADALSTFYADDQRMIELIERILNLSQTALDEADAALGPAGTALPDNVGSAAAVLTVYSAAFKQSEAKLSGLVETLRESARALS